MPTRLPEASDFSPQLAPKISRSTSSPVNAVIFFHGLGDTSQNFAKFAQALNLPETVCIALQGIHPLPFPLPSGSHWGDEFMIDSNTGDPELDAGFEKALDLVVDGAIEQVLLQTCGFRGKEVMLFGFGQGGMVALATAKRCPVELGGVISIGGSLPLSSMLVNGEKCTTPALILGGREGQVTGGAVKSLKQSFQSVEYRQWSKPADSLPQNRDEALPIMQFFARRLRSRQGVPEGSVEMI
ncbi:MAG: hypothetical protein Q9227_001877 [Pyrenula ochraceoflavens]